FPGLRGNPAGQLRLARAPRAVPAAAAPGCPKPDQRRFDAAQPFASMGLFGVFLFLTYYLQEILKFSPVKTGFAFLPMIAALAGMAQVSNRVLLPRFGPKVIVPIGLFLNAVALFL